MKKKVVLAVMVVLIFVSIIAYVYIFKRRLGPLIPPGPYYNEEYVVNFLERYTTDPEKDNIDPQDLVVAMDGLDSLNRSYNQDKLFQYLDTKQGADGTWNTGKGHYVPNTARILMVYARHNVQVKKSLDPFLSTVDTWTEVTAHVNTYDPGNYWGGLWGYVQVWVIYKHQAPPWVSAYLNEVNTNFNDWAYRTHQRNHVLGALVALSEDIPRKIDVLNIILQKQNSDGGWPPGSGPVPPIKENISQVTETYPVINILQNLFESTSEIENAINKGFAFIEANYGEGTRNGQIYAGWSDTIGERPALPATTGAIMALTGKNWQEVTLPSRLANEVIYVRVPYRKFR